MFCRQCHTYTLKGKCEICGSETINPEPAKFSLKDEYGEYRRKMRRVESGGKLC